MSDIFCHLTQSPITSQYGYRVYVFASARRKCTMSCRPVAARNSVGYHIASTAVLTMILMLGASMLAPSLPFSAERELRSNQGDSLPVHDFGAPVRTTAQDSSKLRPEGVIENIGEANHSANRKLWL